MAVRFNLFWCLLFAFAIFMGSARNTISLPGEEVMRTVGFRGRTLKVKVNDYDEASANRGHDPRTRGGWGNGGRGARDNP